MKIASLLLTAALVSAGVVSADTASYGARTYEVTITNVTPGQTFTPILAVTHKASIRIFELGKPASPELATLAESGDVMPLSGLLDTVPRKVFDQATGSGLLGPGESVTLKIHSNRRFNRLSLAAMLIPTNDTFVALDSVSLPKRQGTKFALAYDAGSERNDEHCSNIPGPYCDGEGPSDEDGEGFVHVSNGIHGGADLDPAVFDWRNPIAKVLIRRVH
jgi:hypothetical protein